MSDKPRVAYLVNQYPAVSHSFIRREIFALERLGVDVDRISLTGWDLPLVDPDDLAEREKTTYVQKDGIAALLGAAARMAVTRPGPFFKALGAALSMSRNAVRPLPYHLIYLAQACRILPMVEQTGATHIHAHFGTNPAEIACLIRIMGGPTYSFTNHGSNELDGAPRLHFPRKLGLAKFAVAVSHYCRSQLLRVLPDDQWDKLKVIHCGLDEDYFTEDDLPLPDTPRFLCVGRLSPVKGHLLLLDAFAEVHAEHPDIRLTLAGDGDMRPKIEAKIATLGLINAVDITGWVTAEQVKSLIDKSTALVQPSLIEGLPVVIMEAMARKRPVVSTFIAGIPELVTPETGWLTPAANTPDLVKALKTLLKTNPDALTQMGTKAQSRAKQRHLITTEAQKLKMEFLGED